jgi:hypothetical protein
MRHWNSVVHLELGEQPPHRAPRWSRDFFLPHGLVARSEEWDSRYLPWHRWLCGGWSFRVSSRWKDLPFKSFLSFALELCARGYVDHRREGAYSINTSEHSLLDGVQWFAKLPLWIRSVKKLWKAFPPHRCYEAIQISMICSMQAIWMFGMNRSTTANIPK